MLVGEWNGMLRDDGPAAKGLRSLFHAASARSAGYASVQFADASDPTQFLYSGLMLIGGAPGSTAGGFRLTGIHLTVRGDVTGVDSATFITAARSLMQPQDVSLWMIVIAS